MPIYAYKCSSCGHTQDVLQKVSDALLTDCPECQAATFSKQLTAAGFQLRGSGWYQTDFKNGSAKPKDTAEAKAPAAGDAKSDKAPAAADAKSDKAPAAASGACGHGGCSACS
jgi:putative FmdB family regulatory protein